MPATIAMTESFKDNLARLPAIDGLARIDLLGSDGAVVASIPNQPGKQGSLAVYQYLQQAFGETLDAQAASHGLEIFAEVVTDARANPGAHPNIDHLIAVEQGGPALRIVTVAA